MDSSRPTEPAATHPPRIAVLVCAVLEEEIRHFAEHHPQVIDIEVMEQGLHNEPDRLREELQLAVHRMEDRSAPDAIVLGYGLCSRGVEGVTTRQSRLVVPRAHDCITLLLGSKRRYAEYVRENPGTYWYSPGWNKHHTPPGEDRYHKLQAEYVEKYGEDNAAFLMETEQSWFREYDRATWVDLGVGETHRQIDYTRKCADWLGWRFDRVAGDPALIRSMLSGEWDEGEFLVLQPGQSIRVTADERVIEATVKGRKIDR